MPYYPPPSSGPASGKVLATGTSVADLAVAGTADPDTGLFWPGANVLGLGLGGVGSVLLTPGVSAGTAPAGTPDTDVTIGIGRMLIDNRTTDNVYLSHRDQAGGSAYGLLFTPAGTTVVNATTGQSVRLAVNGSAKVFVDGTGVAFHGTSPGKARPTIAGSRGGNAALADLLTQLAGYGLITDGTTA